MKAFYTIILYTLMGSYVVLAQSNYKPGYIINANGDTLKGFIDFRGWVSNPKSIFFKSAISELKPQILTIENLQFFNVNGIAAYQKFTCRVSMDETNTSRLTFGRDTSFRTETVFLQVLEKGKNVTLYTFTDGLKTRYYIGESPGYAPTELEYRAYQIESDFAAKQGNIKTDNTYLKQLFSIATKDNVLTDGLTQRLNNSGYNEDDLLAIVSAINQISKSEYQKKYAGKSRFNLFVSAGLNITNTSSSSSAPYTQGGGTSHTSYGPVGSLGFNFTPNGITHKVEFRVELSVDEAQFNSAYQLKVSPYVAVKASFNQLGVSLVPQIVYNIYNADNLRIYLGAGLILTHYAYSNLFFGSQNPNVSDGGISENNPFGFNINDTSLLLTAGAKINNKIEIFIKYLTNTSTTQGGYFQLENTREQVGLAYFIGKVK